MVRRHEMAKYVTHYHLPQQPCGYSVWTMQQCVMTLAKLACSPVWGTEVTQAAMWELGSPEPIMIPQRTRVLPRQPRGPQA